MDEEQKQPEPAAETSPSTKKAKPWHPGKIQYAPIFRWPMKPLEILKWALSFPGFLWPWNSLYFALTVVTWLYFQPELSRCVDFRPGWILQMFLRNLALLWIIYGGTHYLLYRKRLQGTKQKYNPRWPRKKSARFLFKSQTYDNIFWSCISGCTIWTAYEVLFMWAYANEHIPGISWREQPVYFIAWLCLIPFWREFHFYWVHRAIHWKPLYRTIHYLHHKNTNPGPWSGLAMHPIEHLLYFSVVLIHWVVPSHPIHMLFNAQHTALTPAAGHHGFDGPVLKGTIPAGSYFHYLHHKYFECNYGESTLPLISYLGPSMMGIKTFKARSLSELQYASLRNTFSPHHANTDYPSRKRS